MIHRTAKSGRRLMWRSLGAASVVALMIVLGCARLAIAQTTTTTTQATTTTTQPGASAESDQAQIAALDQRIDDMRSTVNLLLVAMTILVAVLAGGGLFGLVTSLRSERRAEGRAITVHDLAIRGETAAQNRAQDSYEAFQESSQRTVSLVNDTLDLARQATERAASTIQQKAAGELGALDHRARDILEPVLLGDDFKQVVENPLVRGQVLELASDVASLQGYIQSQELELTPLCLFVKGMGRHLAQQSRAAIKDLRDAVRSANDEPDLWLFAQFWAGYELNNINQPGEAAATFRRAATAVSVGTPRYFELSRIAVESDFFELALGATEPEDYRARLRALDDELAALAQAAQGQPVRLTGVEAAIANTRGNLAFWGAQMSERPEDLDARNRYLNVAREHFEDSDALAPNLWARFGALEAATALTGDVDLDGYRTIDDEIMKRLMNRREPRSMALLSETRFISLCRLSAPISELAAAHRDARDKLQAVDDGLTVYSQMRKHNLAWGDLARELDTLQRKFVPRVE